MADLTSVWALDVHLINAGLHIEGNLLHRRIFPILKLRQAAVRLNEYRFFLENMMENIVFVCLHLCECIYILVLRWQWSMFVDVDCLHILLPPTSTHAFVRELFKTNHFPYLSAFEEFPEDGWRRSG